MAYGPGEVFSYCILAYIMLGFAVISLAHSFFLVKIFDKYIPKDPNEKEENEVTKNCSLTKHWLIWQELQKKQNARNNFSIL